MLDEASLFAGLPGKARKLRIQYAAAPTARQKSVKYDNTNG